MGPVTVAFLVAGVVVCVVMIFGGLWMIFGTIWRVYHPRELRLFTPRQVRVRIKRAIREVDEVFDHAEEHMEEVVDGHQSWWSDWFD